MRNSFSFFHLFWIFCLELGGDGFLTCDYSEMDLGLFLFVGFY